MLFQGGFPLVPTLLRHQWFPELGPWWVCVRRRADVQHCGLAAGTEIQSRVRCLGGVDFQAAGWVLRALSWKSLFQHFCAFHNVLLLKVNQELECFFQLPAIPVNINMSSYGDTIHLCFLAFSFDQMTWTLDDLSVHGACKQRDRKFTKIPWRSLILQAQEKVLNLESKRFTSPAPQMKRATQHRRPKHMAGSGRKRAEAFPLRLLLSLQHLLVTCSLPVVITGPLTWESNWEGREAGETTSVDSSLSIVFFPD